MADDEDYEQVAVTNQQPILKRPERRIDVHEHDTSRGRTGEIVELAEVVLDAMAFQQKEDQLKMEASYADIGGGMSGALSAAAAGASHKDVATMLKRKLDENFGGTWHVIVGSSFGGNVTNDEDSLVNFVIDGVYFLVLRSGPPDRPQMENAGQEEEEGKA